MAVAETRYEHIVLNETNIPIIAEANFKIVHLVMAQQANDWNVEELQEQFPFLTPGQIHSALAYYWDHKEELDRDIERRDQVAEEIRHEVEARPSELRQRLKAQGLL